MNDDWKVNCKFGFDEWQRWRDEWHTYNAIQLGRQAGQFYARVFYAGPGNFSGLISNEALHLARKKWTIDHWMSPRMLIRAMMENKPEILDNYNEWEDVFWNLAMSTIAITKEENNIVKFKNKKGEIKIKHLTIDKYTLCENKEGVRGITFYDENKNKMYKIFPLAELVPQWFTDFESQFLDNVNTLEVFYE